MKKTALFVTLGAMIAIVLVCGLGVHAVMTSTTATSPATTGTWTGPYDPKTGIPTSATAAPHTLLVADGQYLVGKDIPAGRYHTAGAVGAGCYYEVAKDSSGALTSIVTNGNTVGPHYAMLAAGQLFTSQGCKPWQKVG